MKNTLVTAAIALVTAIVGTVIVMSLTPSKTDLTQPLDNNPQSQNYGSVSSPNIASPYITYGGVTEYHYRQSFQASSTLCAIQSPLNATTTLSFAEMNFATSSPFSQTYEIGESLTKNATTTGIVNSYTVGSYNGPIVINATTSVTALIDGTVPPLGWIVFNVSTSTATGINQAVGDCQVGFRIN